MRRLTALLLAGTLPFAAAAQDAASEATRTAQAEIAKRLPLDDPRDEANVLRGKLAEIPGGVILGKDGKTVWDRRPYAFLDAKAAPDTVNPSLWRQARLNAVHGLFEVVPGKIWQVRGYDISVMTIIRGKSGWIIVDPLLSQEAAAASWKLFADTVEAKSGRLPIKAVIFSHSHSDHFGGVGGIVTPEQVKREKIRIIAPHGFSEEATSENVLAGTAMGRRALYMFGSILAPGAAGQVDTGLGPKLSSGTIGYMEPTESVAATGGTLTIDGLAFDFLDAGGTEAPSEFVFYIPAYKALHTTEVVTHTLHNVLTLRGAQVRDALHWSKVIDAALVRWGGKAEVALASHHWPTWGAGEVSSLLANQRDAYRYVHDRTLFLANRGATLHELADQTAEAPVQGKDFSTRNYYGTLNHDMKATYQRYFGWWDGNPANFNPLPPEQSAPKYVALAGGADKLLAAGRAAIKAGDYRWAAELLNKLVFAEPDNRDARAALASAYDQMGYQAESGAWRNYYLAAAATLRGNAVPGGTSNGQSRSFVSAIPTAVFFDALATRFDAAKAGAVKGTFQFILPDSKETVAIVVVGGVEVPRYGLTDPAPTATITINRATLDDVMLGQAQFPALLQSGAIRIDGDRAAFLSWFALHPPADPRFNVVVP
ncbi:MBL fold metallo-hydrolase [Sphingopyxis sp. H038]|uniref:alkyl/aryl-sulfatase n=1 Tax=unclassified Sphingopyxis TaxID=2614943 RepID=UPI000731D06A|nr:MULTISPECIES: alkyl sulfatase dimerization domain-containing protein [unclassified Sphingopyxis]KTE03449.1 MBL fold metallo-hydrolase [Sphingopyxis sp. H012]KTE07954.1 MBL fold metallo-hydrolase [Sphingopyxis sp. H053]KTE13945.1 MBL fold metallo-hydrolase [Sphingopyxis sp. H093]KTE23524.1 MBL fold metallo-hydrolase [Sphingopyxis sp. H080]KTE34260.1 MBL fold metallo-hydrolase [Sphingopyxis sp. H038]